jgi:CubicO group peptidase (beta-lactamase class C family)
MHPGTFKFEKAFGPKNPGDPMDLNATFILASCTKLMTTIAALQCVERGQIGLDDVVSTVLPELKEKEIITGIKEDGSLAYKKAENAITLR